MDLSKKILEKITKEKITPKPRYTFLVKNYLIWLGAGLALILGILSVAVLIYLFKLEDWSILSQIDSKVEVLLISLPYFWIIILGIFIFLAYYNLKHTKSGYKYPLPIILLVYFILILVFGSTSYAIGFGEKLDQTFNKEIPIYQKMMELRQRAWHRPSKGMMAGKILSIDRESKTITIKNLDGEIIKININSTTIPRQMHIEPGMKLKMLGEKLNGDFKPQKLHPMYKQKCPFEKCERNQ